MSRIVPPATRGANLVADRTSATAVRSDVGQTVEGEELEHHFGMIAAGLRLSPEDDPDESSCWLLCSRQSTVKIRNSASPPCFPYVGASTYPQPATHKA